jgi:transcriptional regulator with XRE-family HTH domain
MPSLTRTAISSIECGRRGVKAEEVSMLARILGVAPEDLLEPASAGSLTAGQLAEIFRAGWEEVSGETHPAVTAFAGALRAMMLKAEGIAKGRASS